MEKELEVYLILHFLYHYVHSTLRNITLIELLMVRELEHIIEKIDEVLTNIRKL